MDVTAALQIGLAEPGAWAADHVAGRGWTLPG